MSIMQLPDVLFASTLYLVNAMTSSNLGLTTVFACSPEASSARRVGTSTCHLGHADPVARRGSASGQQPKIGRAPLSAGRHPTADIQTQALPIFPLYRRPHFRHVRYSRRAIAPLHNTSRAQ